MKIECVLRRLGGTTVNIGGIDYLFGPDANGLHVATVTDPDHIRIFASIPGYRIIQDGVTAPQQESTMTASDDRFVAALQAHKDTIQKLIDEKTAIQVQLDAEKAAADSAIAYKDQVSAYLESATASIAAALAPTPAAEQPAPAPAAN